MVLAERRSDQLQRLEAVDAARSLLGDQVLANPADVPHREPQIGKHLLVHALVNEGVGRAVVAPLGDEGVVDVAPLQRVQPDQLPGQGEGGQRLTYLVISRGLHRPS